MNELTKTLFQTRVCNTNIIFDAKSVMKQTISAENWNKQTEC